MDSSLVAIRWSLYADLGLLFGLLLFALYALKASERERLFPLRWLTTVLAGLGIVLSGLSFVLAVAAMLGVALKDVVHASVMMILKIGRAHVSTPVTHEHLVCRLLLENKNSHSTFVILHSSIT